MIEERGLETNDSSDILVIKFVKDMSGREK